MIILGINYGGHDTSASLMKDGAIVAACEQERYTLDKHSRLFPADAIRDCLRIGNVTMDEVDEIAFGFDAMLYIRKTYLESALQDPKRIGFLINDIERIKQAYQLEEILRQKTAFKGPISFHQHHLCHLAGAYYPSGFQEALLVSYDGMGEYHTGLVGAGVNGEIEILDDSSHYPHSLGLLYSAITFYLGWRHHCDEGIVMGLAPYGDPHAKIPGSNRSYYSVFEEIVQETGPYSYRMDTSWISYHHVRDKWVSDKFIVLFGPKRNYGEPLTDHHKNIASALQARLEVLIIGHLRRARNELGFRQLAMSGGVSLNCSMNGKIEELHLFDEIYVQPASGDNGIPIGACFLAYKQRMKKLTPLKDHNSYLGSRFTEEEMDQAFRDAGIEHHKSPDIYSLTAEKLAEGKIVAWFQGAAEFGPRALGNRSILTKPYPADMKDFLNRRVKFREPFRPFAPSVLREHANKYFQLEQESPHMLIAAQVVPQMKAQVPAIVHVNNSCRLQTVTPENNYPFYKLLQAFYQLTGCPVLLNTSFNVKGQPMVNTPQQAIACFLSTHIDFLVVGNFFSEKKTGRSVTTTSLETTPLTAPPPMRELW